MATYEELRSIWTNDSLRNKVDIATIIAANALINGTAAESSWAASVYSSPSSEGRKAFMAVITSNASADLSVIVGASDSEIQSSVDIIVPGLVIAHAAQA